MKEKTNHKNVKEMNFDQLFKQISPEEIGDNIFKLAGKDFFAITAGKENHYNSMVGSEAVGRFFLKNLPPGVLFEQTVILLN